MGAIRKAEGGPSCPDRPRARANGPARPRRPRTAVLDTGITEAARRRLAPSATGDNVDLLDVLPPAGLLDLGIGHGTFSPG